MKKKLLFVIIKQLESAEIGEDMNEKIQVLDVEINNYTAKEMMQEAVEYMKTEPLNVIEMVTMDMLASLREQEDEKKGIREFDITFAGNKDILEAAGVTDSSYLKEADTRIFVKMFFRYLHKNHGKVFLLAEDEQALTNLREYFDTTYSSIRIVDTASLEEHGISDDMILNKVNGAEVDCIIAELPSPIQEQFVIRNRALMNARLWLGLGTGLREERKRGMVRNKLSQFLTRFFIKKEIEQERKRKEQVEEDL